ncbi:MAG TPA: TetR family transcriptional regulator [Solirubrobacteraceae bacterium]|nr:TetR family transcriptional regulator [Solirubrobacteraceae bacterium]
MEDVQRTKILEAMAALVADRGIAGASLADTLSRAGVSRRVFYELFTDRTDCLVAAFELGLERCAARMIPAYESERRWRDGIRGALAEGLRFLDDEPALGRLLVVHSLGASPELLARRVELQERLRDVIDRGRFERAARRSQPPPIAAEGVVGAVLAVIQSRLFAQEADPPDERPAIELFGSLMSLIVLPYLGPTAAQRELRRPAPAPPWEEKGGRTVTPSSFDDHGLRLTYRTVRVLNAIAQYPGASNREVAERADIVDQGQISKLLNRLERAGVIANVGEGTSRGAPNAWSLTPLGEHIAGQVKDRYRRLPRGS